MKLEYIIKENEKYNNIKEILKQEFKISDRLLKKLKKSNQIFINDTPVMINSSFNKNDTISVLLDFEELSENIVSTKIKLDILYEDDCMIIINKPAGIPVHPSIEHYSDSLSNGIKYYFETIKLKRKIRPVNRLDRNTSGIVIFAKNEYIQENLIKQMKDCTFKKEYLALVEGKLNNSNGTIIAPISRKADSIIERTVSISGANAITDYEIIKEFKDFSLVRFILRTGRTHQIRVHCKYIGHPILGDTLYGNKSDLINRQALHAYKITFIHPLTNQKN